MTIVRYDRRDHAIVQQFEKFVGANGYPCVGAKAALASPASSYFIARDICSSWDDLAIHRSLCNFVTRAGAGDGRLRSHIVLFEEATPLSEEVFESALWERVSSISQKDQWMGCPHDAAVSADPDDTRFGVSVGGKAFFVVGMHPGASRPARRFERAAMIFNLHEQFSILRQDGRYGKMKEAIRARDVVLAGSINPMLADHGEISEARQYSGRAVDTGWRCPFSREVANGRRAA